MCWKDNEAPHDKELMVRDQPPRPIQWYVHTLVKNLRIKFLMMLFLVAIGCKFDSCQECPTLRCDDELLLQSPIIKSS